jgi:hypothetical protein
MPKDSPAGRAGLFAFRVVPSGTVYVARLEFVRVACPGFEVADAVMAGAGGASQ